MGVDLRIERIRTSMTEQTGRVLASDAFEGCAQSESISADDLVIFNNSFLFREGRSTSKSNKYLGVIAQASGEVIGPPCVVTTENGINVQFKRVAARQRPRYEIADLDTAIAEQVQHLGSILFALVGRIGEAGAAEVALMGVAGLRFLRYDPTELAPVARRRDGAFMEQTRP